MSDLLLLTNAMGSGLSLEVDLGVPVCVVHDDGVSCLEVQAHSPGSGAQQEDAQAAAWVTESAHLRGLCHASSSSRSKSPLSGGTSNVSCFPQGCHSHTKAWMCVQSQIWSLKRCIAGQDGHLYLLLALLVSTSCSGMLEA